MSLAHSPHPGGPVARTEGDRRIQLDEDPPVGRTEADIRADQLRFERLLNGVSFETAREHVASFLNEAGSTNLDRALGGDVLELVKSYLQGARAVKQEQAAFEAELQQLLAMGSRQGEIELEQVDRQAEHARRELLRHIVEFARRGLQLAEGESVLVDEHLTPQLHRASADCWREEHEESLAELRDSLWLNDTSVSRLLEQQVDYLLRCTSEGPVELPEGIDFVREDTRLFLRRRPPA